MKQLITAIIIVILLSTAVLSMSEFQCQKNIRGNNIVILCLATEEINGIVNSVLKDYSSISDAELLTKELSSMDQNFIKEFQSNINQPGMKRQVHDYLKDTKQGVQFTISEQDAKDLVEEKITYKNFIQASRG